MNVINVSDLSRLAPVGTAAEVTVGATKTTLGLALEETARVVWGQVRSGSVLLTVDGSDPTASHGFLYAAGTQFYVSRSAAAAMKLLRSGGSDATVVVQQMTCGN